MTQVCDRPRELVGDVWTWIKATTLVYLIGFAIVLLGSAARLALREALDLLAWVKA